MSRNPHFWSCRDRKLDLSGRCLVMGILNVTPDSFSDGGKFTRNDEAIRHAMQMIEDGADIIDIGGESTRPGSLPVDAATELERIVPVVQAVSASGRAVISVDTRKAEVAAAALESGAHIINDVSGLGDPAMAGVVARARAGLVIMHMQGTPQTMQDQPDYRDVVIEVAEFLRERVQQAITAGVERDRIVVDPGIGFGKTLEHNLALIAAIQRLETITGCPVLMGVSRKRFIGAITGREVGDRLAGSLAAAACCMQQGARIIRVHDVKESCDIAQMLARLLSA